MDLLRTFVVVHDHGGVSKAADILGRSQPAVSLQIKRLEGVLDETLFSRSTHNFDLTESGNVLLGYARSLLELNDEVMEKFSSQSVRGRVRVGLPSEFAATLMPRIIGRFARQYPDVTLEVSSRLSVELRKQYSQKQFDLVLALQDSVNEDGEGFVKQEELVWVTGSSRVDFGDGPIPLIVAPDGCIYRRRALRALKQAKIKSKIVYTIPDLTGIEAAIQEGLGMTVLARSTVPESLVQSRREMPSLGNIGISLLMRSGQASEAAQRLSTYLQANLQ